MVLKLTKKERDLLWGKTEPYSEAMVVINTRIMGDSISRVMVEVEEHINPTTFRMAEANRGHFKNDPEILDLLEYAEYENDKDGYVVAIGEPEELRDDNSEEVFRNSGLKQEFL